MAKKKTSKIVTKKKEKKRGPQKRIDEAVAIRTMVDRWILDAAAEDVENIGFLVSEQIRCVLRNHFRKSIDERKKIILENFNK